MGDTASPLDSLNFADLEASLAGNQSNAGNPGSGGFTKDPLSGGGAGSRNSAPPVQSLDFILDIPLKITVDSGHSSACPRLSHRTFQVRW
jgi:hypothetical protein